MNNILIIVTRYFGGVKLGAAGLIRAYVHMAKLGIKKSTIIKNVLCEKIRVTIDYSYWSKIENEINNRNNIIHEVEFLDKVNISLFLQKHEKEELINYIKNTTNGNYLIKTFGYRYISMDINKK